MSGQVVEAFMQTRRTFVTSIAAVGAMAATSAHTQDSKWPDHPVRIIVPYPAGGSTDVLTRILAQRFKEIFGQSFVIENRGGAGGQYRYCRRHDESA
jgi:tripartite-type tricarboxylate transporter receptor subunit TctC